jgi:transcriptional regulator GlxA family with amidase domain
MINSKLKLGAIIFNNFELLDLFGPLEMFGRLEEKIEIILISEKNKIVKSTQGPQIVSDFTFENCPKIDILLIPGGLGTRTEINNNKLIDFIKQKSKEASYVATVCTGAALLSKTKLLDFHQATTNKIAFDWVISQNSNVNWIEEARWIEDNKFFTSSGVSAGIDMALALIEKIFNREISYKIAQLTEYIWNEDKNFDPFSRNRKFKA